MGHACVGEAELVEEEPRKHQWPMNSNKRLTERYHAFVAKAALRAVHSEPE